ncbi:hypothetical protein [Streptomyces sp. S8]|uniref:hypothetical protein n=1 Tax=Streptomyces sp. S8 TaxID=1837283 RepID=UPI00131B9B36|nr:hypothetical protein [Streptomyces sp. S8]
MDHVEQDHDELVGVAFRPLDLRPLLQGPGEAVVRLDLLGLRRRELDRIPRTLPGRRACRGAGCGAQRLLT